MIVLSLFDGISCGRLALERAGIPVTKYYASEIDSNAESISKHNYPDIIRIGDVTKWRNWNIDIPDIIIGGSSCQSFSCSGNGSGFAGKSSVYYDYRDIVKSYNPKYFLLENVVMKSEWKNAISKDMGVQPVMINSALVSAQARKRLYWSNLTISQPQHNHIYMRDILQKDGIPKHLYKDVSKRGIDKTSLVELFKTPTYDEPKCLAHIGKGGQGYRIYSPNGKGVTITANGGGLGRQTGLYLDLDHNVRRLSVTECERMQTLPDGYCGTSVADANKYKALGNGWTVDVIAHIFKGIK